MYADVDFYKNTYGGALAPDPVITKWLGRAHDDIDVLTDHMIDVAVLPSLFLELVKKAECAQAEHYIINGDTMQSCVSQASIGGFSYSAIERNFSPRARMYLTSAGLLYRG